MPHVKDWKEITIANREGPMASRAGERLERARQLLAFEDSVLGHQRHRTRRAPQGHREGVNVDPVPLEEPDTDFLPQLAQPLFKPAPVDLMAPVVDDELNDLVEGEMQLIVLGVVARIDRKDGLQT
jgi:hypothetical protein